MSMLLPQFYALDLWASTFNPHDGIEIVNLRNQLEQAQSEGKAAGHFNISDWILLKAVFATKARQCWGSVTNPSAECDFFIARGNLFVVPMRLSFQADRDWIGIAVADAGSTGSGADARQQRKRLGQSSTANQTSHSEETFV